MMFMSPQQFAEYANKMVQIREESYVSGQGYKKDWHVCAEEALIPKEWQWPIILFCFDGYAESGEWCEQYGSKKS